MTSADFSLDFIYNILACHYWLLSLRNKHVIVHRCHVHSVTCANTVNNPGEQAFCPRIPDTCPHIHLIWLWTLDGTDMCTDGHQVVPFSKHVSLIFRSIISYFSVKVWPMASILTSVLYPTWLHLSEPRPSLHNFPSGSRAQIKRPPSCAVTAK